MFPLRPPFFGYPFNNLYLNSRRSPYSPYNISINKNSSLSPNAVFNEQHDFIGANDVTNNSKISKASLSSVSFAHNETEKKKEKDSFNEPFEDYFFEIFGLRLYFDDILIICILFFLYEEEVGDQELFISLILLLLS